MEGREPAARQHQVTARIALREGGEDVASRVGARVQELCADATRVEWTMHGTELRLVIVLAAPTGAAAIHYCRPRVTLAVGGVPEVAPGPGSVLLTALPALA
ncbi:MAG: hypothetical protein JHC95_04930 [Solirubrobacteraceae bacterium]|nr:hypothetical protein [Solirubrobacteraceae bacterium]